MTPIQRIQQAIISLLGLTDAGIGVSNSDCCFYHYTLKSHEATNALFTTESQATFIRAVTWLTNRENIKGIPNKKISSSELQQHIEKAITEKKQFKGDENFHLSNGICIAAVIDAGFDCKTYLCYRDAICNLSEKFVTSDSDDT